MYALSGHFRCMFRHACLKICRMSLHPESVRLAAKDSIPVLTGYVLLGMAYGIFMNTSGFPWYYPVIMAVVIYGGSLEFVAVSLLLSRFAPLQTFLLAFMIQARHLFYGLAMLGKYHGAGNRKFYLIYALTDETFAVAGSRVLPDNINKYDYYFTLSLLDHCYWITGAALGGIFGSFLPFDTTGLDFMMTAMFVVIFLDAWMREKSHLSSLIGFGASFLCLVLFGADGFIIPSMCVILCFLLVFRKTIAEKGGFE